VDNSSFFLWNFAVFILNYLSVCTIYKKKNALVIFNQNIFSIFSLMTFTGAGGGTTCHLHEITAIRSNYLPMDKIKSRLTFIFYSLSCFTQIYITIGKRWLSQLLFPVNFKVYFRLKSFLCHQECPHTVCSLIFVSMWTVCIQQHMY